MSKAVGIDYGTKRVGLAISDVNGMIASPLETVHSSQVIPYLKALVDREQISDMVIGMPVDLRNREADATESVRNFLKHLERTFPSTTIHVEDERFTSKLAEQAIRSSGVSKKKRQDKGLVDRLSAALILQSFLDRRSSGKQFSS